MNSSFPISPVTALQFFKAAVDGFDYLQRVQDRYEKEQRYDDNAKKLLEQAFRLYQAGQISQEAYLKIVEAMPHTQPVQEVTVIANWFDS